MPPKTRKKAAAPDQAPTAALPNSRVRKRGPSNADKTTTKPKTKKAKKTKNIPADDDEAGNEKGEENRRKPARGKKTRCVTPRLHSSPRTDGLRTRDRKTSTAKAAETAAEADPDSDEMKKYVPPPPLFFNPETNAKQDRVYARGERHICCSP